MPPAEPTPEARHARIGAAVPDELLHIWFQYAPEHVDTAIHEDLKAEIAARRKP